jgi:hypothetical protein
LYKNSQMYSFYFGTEVEARKYSNCIPFGRYILSYSDNTAVAYAENADSELALLGDAVDLKTGRFEDLPGLLISGIDTIESLVCREHDLGGKYVIFYRSQDAYYLVGDATCSIPICYTAVFDGVFACSSNLNDICRDRKYRQDATLLKIRNSGDPSQAMPFDYTIYREIRHLIPNHYLDVEQRKSVRFINQSQIMPTVSPFDAASMTLPLIRKLADYYSAKYPLYCPITSGRDSRVVLAFLMEKNDSLPCYTIRHAHQSENEQDLTTPGQLCALSNLPYTQIEDVPLHERTALSMNKALSENTYSKRTLMIANTVHEYCGENAIVNGDIIGQVGKCSLHRDIPQCLATPAYFRCKLHNYSRESLEALREWLREVKLSGEKVSSFDLFSIENRMGRWAAQENLIYNTIGQRYLNLFNSRCIIYVWTSVSRKLRKLSAIHLSLIKLLNYQLLSVPFESDKGCLVRFSKSNGLLYYGFSFVKHWKEYWDYKRGSRRT